MDVEHSFISRGTKKEREESVCYLKTDITIFPSVLKVIECIDYCFKALLVGLDLLVMMPDTFCLCLAVMYKNIVSLSYLTFMNLNFNRTGRIFSLFTQNSVKFNQSLASDKFTK